MEMSNQDPVPQLSLVPPHLLCECGHHTVQITQAAKLESGNWAWQCQHCGKWWEDIEGSIIEEAPKKLDKPIPLHNIYFQSGWSFNCPLCFSQNFIPCEAPLDMIEIDVICYACRIKFNISRDTGVITSHE